MTDINRVRELAGKASQAAGTGEWVYVLPEPLDSGWIRAANDGPVVAVVQWPVPTADHMLGGIDASAPIGNFIAAANPTFLLALLARLERAEKALTDLREAAKPFQDAASHLHPSTADDGLTLDGIQVRHWRALATLEERPETSGFAWTEYPRPARATGEYRWPPAKQVETLSEEEMPEKYCAHGVLIFGDRIRCEGCEQDALAALARDQETT